MMGKLNLVNSPRTNETLELNMKLETSYIYIYLCVCVCQYNIYSIYIYNIIYIYYNTYICLIVDLSLFFSSGCGYIWLYLVI